MEQPVFSMLATTDSDQTPDYQPELQEHKTQINNLNMNYIQLQSIS